MLKLAINGETRAVEVDPDTPLLWVLREEIGLTGTKFGCGIGACGACTVLLDGVATRSCTTPVSAVGAAAITTIEGLGGGHPVQRAWLALAVPQCGYCQSGQILSAVALLERVPHPSDAEINTAMDGNLCRCGTYPRIRAAIRLLADANGDSP